jgi:hypothetical protein
MGRNHRHAAVVGLALVSVWGCGMARMRDSKLASVSLEVFIVAPVADGEAIRYVRRITQLSNGSADPDAVARGLTSGIAKPTILHSTSWRWEKDGTIILTYLAYCEDAEFKGAEPVQLPWDQLAPPAATDPQRPRPFEIREVDVISHGLRHLSFLIRYARDGRLAAGLLPRSASFFRAMCGQLAGRLDAARDFEECAAVGTR